MKTHAGPKALTEYILYSSKAKVNKSFTNLSTQGILAGMYIAIGAIAYFKTVGSISDPGLGNLLGAVAFPVGIIAIILMQTELFTSDTMIMISVYFKQQKLSKILKILAVVLVTNILGCIIVAFLTTGAGIFNADTMALVVAKAEHKVHIPTGQLFISSILCNIIVSTGVCLAYSCGEEISKIIAVWLAITVFVLTGTEHVVANGFYFALGYINGADVTILQILKSLVIAGIGNFIGGGIIVSGANFILSRHEIGKGE